MLACMTPRLPEPSRTVEAILVLAMLCGVLVARPA